MTTDLIYLDNNATTKIDDRVLGEMMPYFNENYGNAHSSHSLGLHSKKIVENARERIASFFDVKVRDVVFTSGATESINLALKGIAHLKSGDGNHIITFCTEHSAVLNTCKYLEKIGFEVTYLPVKNNGEIDMELYQSTFRKKTILVVAMLANNETGVILPIHHLAEIAGLHGALFFSDFTQAIGKMEVKSKTLGVDSFCFSGHKIHGPKGIGALIFNSDKLGQIESLLHGGDQEFGIRAGTLNVPGIVGLAKAVEIIDLEMPSYLTEMKQLRDSAESSLLSIQGAFINAENAERISNTTSICIPGIDANVLISKLKNLAISSGSACNSAIMQPSHVLTGMGLNPDLANASFRISLSRFTSKKEIETASNILKVQIQKELNSFVNYA